MADLRECFGNITYRWIPVDSNNLATIINMPLLDWLINHM